MEGTIQQACIVLSRLVMTTHLIIKHHLHTYIPSTQPRHSPVSFLLIRSIHKFTLSIRISLFETFHINEIIEYSVVSLISFTWNVNKVHLHYSTHPYFIFIWLNILLQQSIILFILQIINGLWVVSKSWLV